MGLGRVCARIAGLSAANGRACGRDRVLSAVCGEGEVGLRRARLAGLLARLAVEERNAAVDQARNRGRAASPFVGWLSSVVDDGGSVIDEGGSVIDEGGSVFDEGGSVFDEGGSVIDEGGSVIDEGGSVIDEGGLVVEDDGLVVEDGRWADRVGRATGRLRSSAASTRARSLRPRNATVDPPTRPRSRRRPARSPRSAAFWSADKYKGAARSNRDHRARA